MFTVVIALAIIVCILLILVILAQNPKGGGLSSQFGGSGTSQIMGVKKTTDLLERITWTLGIALLVLSLSTNFIIATRTETSISSPNIERAKETAITPSFNQQELNDLQDAQEANPAATEPDADLVDQLSEDDQGKEESTEQQ